VLAEAQAIAVKHAPAYQLKGSDEGADAQQDSTGRADEHQSFPLERLLDPDNSSVTLPTLERAARGPVKNIRLKSPPGTSSLVIQENGASTAFGRNT
jgi:hypothetical protein